MKELCRDFDEDTGLRCMRLAGHSGDHEVTISWENEEAPRQPEG